MWSGLGTILGTIFIGVSIFVLGQIVERLWIGPVHELKNTLGKTAHALTLHWGVAGRWFTEDGEHVEPREKLDPIRDALQNVAAELRANQAVIPWYRVTQKIFGLPTKEEIKDASAALYSWSIAIYGHGNGIANYPTRIDEALKLKTDWYWDHTSSTKKKVKRKSKIRFSCRPLHRGYGRAA
jgi:hypothetical protein